MRWQQFLRASLVGDQMMEMADLRRNLNQGRVDVHPRSVSLHKKIATSSEAQSDIRANSRSISSSERTYFSAMALSTHGDAHEMTRREDADEMLTLFCTCSSHRHSECEPWPIYQMDLFVFVSRRHFVGTLIKFVLLVYSPAPKRKIGRVAEIKVEGEPGMERG
jgi:hypothetical protein